MIGLRTTQMTTASIIPWTLASRAGEPWTLAPRAGEPSQDRPQTVDADELTPLSAGPSQVSCRSACLSLPAFYKLSLM